MSLSRLDRIPAVVTGDAATCYAPALLGTPEMRPDAVSSGLLNTKKVEPIHGRLRTRCAQALDVHVSVTQNASPPTKRPRVMRVGVRALAGGLPATLIGVKSSFLALRCSLTIHRPVLFHPSI